MTFTLGLHIETANMIANKAITMLTPSNQLDSNIL